MMHRAQVLEILKEYVRSDSLVMHLVAAEAAMRAYARKFGEDEEKWGIVGLLHDFDWEVCPSPEDHPTYGANILRERGFPEEIVRAILSHGDHTGLKRESLMEKTFFAVDELSGFIRAVALVRPSRSLDDVQPRSVKRKMKDKSFAREVRREDITNGAQELGVELDEHIAFVIQSMMPVAGELGLNVGPL